MRISTSIVTLFPVEWLDAKAEGDPRGRTNREVQTEVGLRVPFSAEGFFFQLNNLFRAS